MSVRQEKEFLCLNIIKMLYLLIVNQESHAKFSVILMCEITFKKGSKGNFHKHEHLQITYIAKGSFEFTIGGETKIVNQGDSVYMPSNVEHGVTALEDGILVDVFNPMRKDFLA